MEIGGWSVAAQPTARSKKCKVDRKSHKGGGVEGVRGERVYEWRLEVETGGWSVAAQPGLTRAHTQLV